MAEGHQVIIPQLQGQRPIRQGHSFLTTLLIVAFSGVIPAIWVAMTPPFRKPDEAEERTRGRLATNNRAIRVYLAMHKKVPETLSGARDFALAQKLPFESYDAFGGRFEYVKLSNDQYLLRSFGADEEQNSLTSALDFTVGYWGVRPVLGISPSFPKKADVGPFQAVVLPAFDSYDHAWLGRLFVDQKTGNRQLSVRHRSKKGLFMLAPHDRVEEFFWLPDNHSLVFTGSGSLRYRDGLFLWNLKSDTVVNLTERFAQSSALAPSKASTKLWLSLAGVSASPTRVYAFMSPRHDGAITSEAFYHPSKLFGVEINSNGSLTFLPSPTIDEKTIQTFMSGDRARHLNREGGLDIQRSFLRLPITGGAVDLIDDWQKFASEERESPLYPYTLWGLIELYTHAASGAVGEKEKNIMRSYGAEVSKVLVNDSSAPSYLRGLALGAFNQFMEEGK